MKLRSLIKSNHQLLPIEVEFSLLPGLPNIQIVGLPDAAIKESVIKIKSALRLQGFEFPRSKTVVVNLRPSHIRKSSQGLELAIAIGILLCTQQVAWPPMVDKDLAYLYGEINLQGEVFCPSDLQWFDDFENEILITGENSFDFLGRQYQIQRLCDFDKGILKFSSEPKIQFQRPQLPNLLFTPSQARLMEIMAVGEHSTLIAGPSGSGKSTLVHSIHFLLREPTPVQFSEIRKIWREKTPLWRPVVAPHHTVTPLAMIGGGLPPRFGEITRAHGGILIMDEFLQFHREAFEALREPMEEGHITISRGGQSQKFLAKFLLLATTNLCPCGAFVPKRDHNCGCGTYRRQTYLARINGPVLDRLAIIGFSDEWDKEKGTQLNLKELLSRIIKAIDFAKESRQQTQPNSEVEFDDAGLSKIVVPKTSSLRRLKYLRQVARTIADLDLSEDIKPWHFEEALNFCLKSHQLLTTQLALY